MRGRVLPYGAEAVLVEVDGIAEAHSLARAVSKLSWRRAPGWETVVDTVPGARSVVVFARPEAVPDLPGRLTDLLATLEVEPERAPYVTVTVPVTYDGPDLDEVARLTGLTVDEVVAAHTGTPWLVGFTGFTPGFAYLVGGDPRLQVPRRGEPRANVPGGSVALAGPYSGVYPRPGPGGWQIIGHTEVAVWQPNPHQEQLFTPGVAVRFEVA